MTFYLKNTSGSTVRINDIGLEIPDAQSIVIDSNEINGFLSSDLSASINAGDLILSSTDIGDTGGDMSIADAIDALSITSRFDRDNPHQVTLAQAASEDPNTDITVDELERLTDGGDASDTTELHHHDTRYHTKVELATSNTGTVEVNWDNITNAPSFGSPNWQAPVDYMLHGFGPETERDAATPEEGWYWLNTDDDHVYRYDGATWVDQGAPTDGDRVIYKIDSVAPDDSDDKIYTYDTGAWDAGEVPEDNWSVFVNNDGDGKPAQYIYDTQGAPPDWTKIADVDWGDHNSIGGRGDADAHPATSITYNNSISNLDATTIQDALDEIALEQGVTIDNLLIVSTNGDDLATGVDLGTWANPFATVQAALDSVSGASSTNRYGILVTPGDYTDNVTHGKAFTYVFGMDRKSTRIKSASGDTYSLTNTTEGATGLFNISIVSDSSTSTDNSIVITGNEPVLNNVESSAASGARSLYVNGAFAQTLNDVDLISGTFRIDSGIVRFVDSRVEDALTNITNGTLRIENGSFSNPNGDAIKQDGGTVIFVGGKTESEAASLDYNQTAGTVYWGWVEYDEAKVDYQGTKFLLFPSGDLSYNNSTSGLTATNVEAAINELDENIDNAGTALTDHENDTTNPHVVTLTQAATADPGTDVTVAEIETLTDTSNADLLHAHAAAGVTYDDTTSGLGAVNVQVAIEKLDENIDNAGTALTDHENDTANPHTVTFTQAVAADSGTDITVAEAETLTDASNADALHEHSAAGVTFDDTVTQLGASSVQEALVKLDAELDNTLPRGTEFPLTPEGGDLYYRTDHNLTYQFDSSRGKWLSITQMFLDWGSNNADGRYLHIHGSSGTQSGYLMPRDGVILSLTAKGASGNLSKGLEIHKNHNVATPLKSMSLSGGTYASITEDISFTAGDYIQAYASSTGTPVRDIVVMATIAYTAS